MADGGGRFESLAVFSDSSDVFCLYDRRTDLCYLRKGTAQVPLGWMKPRSAFVALSKMRLAGRKVPRRAFKRLQDQMRDDGGRND